MDTPFCPLVRNAETEAKSDFDAFMSSADDCYLALICLLFAKSAIRLKHSRARWQLKGYIKETFARIPSRSKHIIARWLLKTLESMRDDWLNIVQSIPQQQIFPKLLSIHNGIFFVAASSSPSSRLS